MRLFPCSSRDPSLRQLARLVFKDPFRRLWSSAREERRWGVDWQKPGGMGPVREFA